MSSQTPDRKDKPKQGPKELIDDVRHTLDTVIKSLNVQVLGNADGLHEIISNEKEKKELKILVENMIKRPFRRQVGRLKQINRLLIEAQNRLE